MNKISYKPALTSTAMFAMNSDYLEDLYEKYLHNPKQISSEWVDYFDALPYQTPGKVEVSHNQVRDDFKDLARHSYRIQPTAHVDQAEVGSLKIQRLLDAYRRHAHLIADSGNFEPISYDINLFDLHSFGLNVHDSALYPDPISGAKKTLQEILQGIKDVYCQNIGYEYMHLDSADEIAWFQQKIEKNTQSIDLLQKKYLLQDIMRAEQMEKYLGTQFVGQKRFSLEGCEALIPMLNTLISDSAEYVNEVVIGMAHRGRLNVMLNVLGMPTAELVREFTGDKVMSTSGDVKYHLGYSINRKIAGKLVHVSLAYNPSHLEAIYPVVLGNCRARIDQQDKIATLPILIHGDASLSGQGVVMECLNMAYVPAYRVGGSIHIVVNNQIGFTAEAVDGRSSRYCTDIGKFIGAPVLHVHADYPESVYRCAVLAAEYRKVFGKDIFIDLIGFRRHGHNEADEPRSTQPKMYKIINKHPGVVSLYAQSLKKQAMIDDAEITQIKKSIIQALKSGDKLVETEKTNESVRALAWSKIKNSGDGVYGDNKNNISRKTLTELGMQINHLPAGFSLQKQVELMFAQRQKMIKGSVPINWGLAELLAYASLLKQGHSVRLVGEDVCRGTFSHRQAVVVDQVSYKSYCALSEISKANKQQFYLYNSVLSEYAALGFEYGYAETMPATLVLWEAQFGDFVNGAQIIIDQFISSAWQKWQRKCGLVLLLPHGHEGSGPEHSSARLERFLQLSAENNMQVCVPTTPAQIYHLLRRQILTDYREPLVVMTPKSLLRHPKAVSDLSTLTTGKFETVLQDEKKITATKITRVVLCSGKVYYELINKREEKALSNVAILRVEQLYPFPVNRVRSILLQYRQAKEVVWCQEEPKNQGAWYMMRAVLEKCLHQGQSLTYHGRVKSASPAVGYVRLHTESQILLIEQALGLVS